MGIKINAGELEQAVCEELEAYTEEFQTKAAETTNRVAKECVKELKSTSPKRPNDGEYAKDWAVKKMTQGRVFQFVVHNRKHYQLTHLLENGHIIANQFGKGYGRTSAIPHIKPAEEKYTDELVKELEDL